MIVVRVGNDWSEGLYLTKACVDDLNQGHKLLASLPFVPLGWRDPSLLPIYLSPSGGFFRHVLKRNVFITAHHFI